jgi:hypothetical protein
MKIISFTTCSSEDIKEILKNNFNPMCMISFLLSLKLVALNRNTFKNMCKTVAVWTTISLPIVKLRIPNLSLLVSHVTRAFGYPKITSMFTTRHTLKKLYFYIHVHSLICIFVMIRRLGVTHEKLFRLEWPFFATGIEQGEITFSL